MAIGKLRSLIKSRKNGFEDAFFVLVVVFTIAIFMMVLVKSWSEMKTPLDEGLSNAMPDDSSVNVTTILNKTTNTTLLFDKMFPFLLVGLIGFIFIVASVYANHPIMLFVGIFILAIAILLAVIYANIYNNIAESDEFTTTNDNMPIQSAFMEYLPYFIFVIFILITVAIIWARKGSGTSGL